MPAPFLTRRRFLQSAAAGAALLGAAPARAAIRPNDRIRAAVIGLGGMGRSHLNRLIENPEVEVIAVADPDQQRQAAAKAEAKAAGVEVTTYSRYPEMLSVHPDLDAVFIATPDHWHALATIDCLHAGMDVYCEKPLALTIDQGRRMVAAAQRFGRIVQVGTMQRSNMPQFRKACELVVNGRIGTVDRVVCHFSANPAIAFVPDTAPPDYLDWDFWLGPAPTRAFNPQIHPYNFRYFKDYSGGLLTDWGIHLFDIAQWGLQKDATSPKRVEAEFSMYPDNLYEFPKTARIQYDYGDVTLEWLQGTDEVVEPGVGYGTKFYGSEGEVHVNRDGYVARRKDGKPVDEILGADAVRLHAATSHHQDFFDAMRSRKAPICDIESGHRGAAISHLGNIAIQVGRPLDYDPVAEVFPNDPTANRLLAKPMRAPWRL
jgi:predicted dehydrogenase